MCVVYFDNQNRLNPWWWWLHTLNYYYHYFVQICATRNLITFHVIDCKILCISVHTSTVFNGERFIELLRIWNACCRLIFNNTSPSSCAYSYCLKTLKLHTGLLCQCQWLQITNYNWIFIAINSWNWLNTTLIHTYMHA